MILYSHRQEQPESAQVTMMLDPTVFTLYGMFDSTLYAELEASHIYTVALVYCVSTTLMRGWFQITLLTLC